MTELVPLLLAFVSGAAFMAGILAGRKTERR